MKVSEVMSRKLRMLPPTATLWDAATLMDQEDIRHVAICEYGVLCGLVSDRDIRRFELPFDEAKLDPRAAIERYEVKLSEFMTSDPIVLTAETDLVEAIDVMLAGTFGAIPIVDPETEKLIGMLSYVDILAAVKPMLSR